MIEKENSIKLVMMGARRDDTGIYTLKADNDHGQDQADVEVVVMVEPSKPRGPMKMNDITADGIYTKLFFSYLLLHINSFVLPFSLNATLQSVKQRLIYLWKLIEMIQGCTKGQKSGGAGSNAARRRCPAAPSDLPKSGGAAVPPAPPLGASLC